MNTSYRRKLPPFTIRAGILVISLIAFSCASTAPQTKRAKLNDTQKLALSTWVGDKRGEIAECLKGLAANQSKVLDTIQLFWILQEDGRFTDVELMSTSLEDQNAIDCLVNKVSAWRFPGKVVKPTDVLYSMDLVADKKGPAPTQDPKPLPPEKKKGGLSKDAIQTIIRKNMHEIGDCYQKELAADPTLEGKLTFRFLIQPDGTVGSITPTQNTFPDPNVKRCVKLRIKQWKFPKPVAGMPVTVNYPFIFKLEKKKQGSLKAKP